MFVCVYVKGNVENRKSRSEYSKDLFYLYFNFFVQGAHEKGKETSFIFSNFWEPELKSQLYLSTICHIVSVGKLILSSELTDLQMNGICLTDKLGAA